MSNTRAQLETEIANIKSNLSVMENTLRSMPVEKRKLAIFKGDYVLGLRKGASYPDKRVFLVQSATPTAAKLICLSAGNLGRHTVSLAGNNTINADTCHSIYKFKNVISQEEALALL